jgi:hypothetical protein
MAIDGSKYYYWKGRYLATGSLKAFDLMTRHYEAGNFADFAPPVGRRRRISVNPVEELIKASYIVGIDPASSREPILSILRRDEKGTVNVTTVGGTL